MYPSYGTGQGYMEKALTFGWSEMITIHELRLLLKVSKEITKRILTIIVIRVKSRSITVFEKSHTKILQEVILCRKTMVSSPGCLL